MPQTMLEGFFAARQAQANLAQTEAQTASLYAKQQAEAADAQRRAQLSDAVRQVLGYGAPTDQPPQANAALGTPQAAATRAGDTRSAIDPNSGRVLADAVNLPYNLAAKETSFGRSRMESQAEKMRALGDLHILMGESRIGRQFLDSAGLAEKRAGEIEEKELKIEAAQADAMGSLAATVNSQESLDRALLAGMSRGYDVSQLMEATGGQWNEESAQALEQYARASVSVKDQAKMDLDIIKEERAAENTESMIRDRSIRQSIARSNLLLKRELFEYKKTTGGSKGGAQRIGGLTFTERDKLFKAENQIRDPVEMYSLKKHNPALYESEVERMKNLELDRNKWHVENFGVDWTGKDPNAEPAVAEEPEVPAARGALKGEKYRSVIDDASAETGVPAHIISSVIQVESGWNPKIVSPAGAGGLMQIMPRTATHLGISEADRFKPEVAIPAGARLLAELYNQFGSWPKALAAYNAGPGRVASGKALPAETQAYVPKVLSWAKRYEAGGAGAPEPAVTGLSKVKAPTAEQPAGEPSSGVDPAVVARAKAAGYSDAQIERAMARAKQAKK